ncbi:Tripeptidyl-peptidase sed4 [Colletotrichum higginsianum IMI 349063]|uniref:tripeptidyl-peptidase II n=2 Tax=Colletotrichum higginsianum TaxID=80884 RepID=A0A1B7YGL6_COLHI|nr:Tripeptidyl-peptidase sed4 [Colletotrichum higginsianum IMI 349063]OBR11122.1 Tripeptidyl-peptidase sed4 [Colletotrichum higginsianum IMI 349063]TIC90930.1 Tripeptidyl-peptidase sed2 [Colletotrichum higginsianum]
MRSSWVITPLLLSGFALSHPTSGGHVVHESVEQLPRGWRHVAPAEDLNTVRLSVALKQPGLSELKARLEVTSDPSHSQYGAHVSRDLLKYFQEPEAESFSAVASWLQSNDIPNFVRDGPWVRLNTTVGKANRLLDCKFAKYQYNTGDVVLRAKEYTLPARLLEHVDFVYPVSQFVSKPPRREIKMRDSGMTKRQSTMPQSCWSYTTPDCLVELYNINYHLPDDQSPTDFAIAGFLEEYPSVPTLQAFLASYSPLRNTTGYSPKYNLTVESINGGGDTTEGGGVEALLDIQYSMPFIQPMNVTYFSTGGRGPEIGDDGRDKTPDESGNEPWIEFLEALLARDAIPHVISISYTDDEQAIPLPYARRVCDLFMQVAARGVSILVATGDGGAAGIRSGNCVSNDGTNTTKFLPTFPVDCPYVTGVGATGNYAPAEPAWYSSGGFSEYFERPAWQESVAAAYIAGINGSHSGWYAPKGRGIPDISAVGSRFLMQPGWTQKGTSASTPVVAAMIALANDKRMRQGRPPLGFLNPLLYSDKVRSAINDVTSGSSGSCPVGDQVESGWLATAGWDPATGLGTLDFAKFVAALE